MDTVHEITASDIKRFWRKVDRRGGPDACWLWKAGLFANGYGQFSAGGKNYKAHRFAWIITVGHIIDGFVLCHRCDNPRCVNPARLFLGTNADNAADRDRKGRLKVCRGSAVGTSRLKETDIPLIRQLIAEGGENGEIGRRFGVSYRTIERIRVGESWGHV